jgi:hypothetical protein
MPLLYKLGYLTIALLFAIGAQFFSGEFGDDRQDLEVEWYPA